MRNIVCSVLAWSCAVLLSGCGGGQRTAVLTADGAPSVTVMDFKKPLAFDPVPVGQPHIAPMSFPPKPRWAASPAPSRTTSPRAASPSTASPPA